MDEWTFACVLQNIGLLGLLSKKGRSRPDTRPSRWAWRFSHVPYKATNQPTSHLTNKLSKSLRRIIEAHLQTNPADMPCLPWRVFMSLFIRSLFFRNCPSASLSVSLLTAEHRYITPANKACSPIRHRVWCSIIKFVVISLMAVKQLHLNALLWNSTVARSVSVSFPVSFPSYPSFAFLRWPLHLTWQRKTNDQTMLCKTDEQTITPFEWV